MNNIRHEEELVDEDLVKQYVEELIKEHKAFSPSNIGNVMEYDQALHAANVTCKRLAQETAKKFYYACITYIMDLNE